jgi:hypothetical protein
LRPRNHLLATTIYRLMGRFALLAIISTLVIGCSRGELSSPSASPSTTASAGPTASSPTQTPVADTTPVPDTLVRCADFPQQTYTNSKVGFNVSCPIGFLWETYSNLYHAKFLAAVVEDKGSGAGDPRGSISITIYSDDAASLRDWISAHTGPPNSDQPTHFWRLTTNLSDAQVSGRPAIGFDASALGPGPPPTSHDVAFLLSDGDVFVIAWGAYSTDYAAKLSTVGEEMVTSIKA